MKKSPHVQVELITESANLERLAQDLASETVLAVDLETDSYHCYFSRVCLLQFTSPRFSALVDPLALPTLEPLRPVFADARIRKIFHAADYDIRCLHRDFGFEVHSLFDTMVGCKLLGEQNLGLADLLSAAFGVTLDKRFQCANWALRPLTEEMLAYALEDTTHLIPFAEMVEQRLRDAGRLAWAQEEFALLEKLRHSEMPGHLRQAVAEAAAFTPRQLAALERLLRWRDAEARRQGCRYLHIVGTSHLAALAAALPTTSQEMEKIAEVPLALKRRYGVSFLRILDEARRLPEEALPEPAPEPVPHPRRGAGNSLLKDLKNWRRNAAQELGLDPGTLINNHMLEEIARCRPRTLTALSTISGIKQWQLRELGNSLLRQVTHHAQSHSGSGKTPQTDSP